MSLQLAAQHLANHGRGNDSTLVHMSPREVKSLNDLARAHGGQLTTNPHTGLPEAGFLESILPMVAGAGLMAVSGGAINPMTAGLITGGLGFAMTGSLQKGLMAGLGAYGGAGLGEALAAQGMQAAAAPELAAAQSQLSTLTPAQISEFQAATGPVTSGPVFDAQQAAKLAAEKTATAQTAYGNAGFMDKLSTMGKGISTLGQEGGISNLYNNLGGSPMSLLRTVGSAAAPAIGAAMTPEKKNQNPATDANMGQRYGFAMNPTSGQPQQTQGGQNPPGTPQTTTPFPTPDIYGREQRYFAPSYTKLTPDAAKSLYGYAGGGPIEAMSNANAVGANTGYPMANIGQGAYATPYQQPISRNVLSDTADTGVNPITGEMAFADGGAIDEDRPTETPALQMFKQMQAQRATQPAAAPIDANAAFNAYAQQSLGTPNQLQAPPATDPTTVPTPNGYGYMYNPVAQKYTQVQGTPSAPNDSSDNPFSIENRPVIGYTATGDKIYGEQPSGGFNIGRGFGRAAGGSITDAHYNLGGYSDGGRLLRGPGDGVSDSIPAVIGQKQPARLADGEFVVPARIVSELGNGSTEAGARKLYAMLDRIQAARGKTVGKGKVAKNSRADKHLPA